ncbi:MAG: S9 family peptidase, partial [Sphingomicrobium sp.]
MRFYLLAAAAAALPVSAAAATLHQYSALALSPAGDRVATVESDAQANATTKPHGRIVVRSASSGMILEALDPCRTCDYSGLTFAPDGRFLVLARENGKTRLMEAAKGGPATLATISGIAEDPRFSQDGRRIALLVTIGARKEAGATQAGVRQVGEIGQQN